MAKCAATYEDEGGYLKYKKCIWDSLIFYKPLVGFVMISEGRYPLYFLKQLEK